MFLESIDSCLELRILLCKFGVKLLLEVQISAHVSDLSVPVVQLIALVRVVSLCQSKPALNLTIELLLGLQVSLHPVHSFLHGCFVGIEGSSESFSIISFLLRLYFLKLELFEPLLDLFLLGLSLLDSELVKLLLTEFYLLEVLQSGGELPQVLSQGLVLE